MSSRLPAHHQEVLLRIYSSWYMSCVYAGWLLAESYCTDISRYTVKKTLKIYISCLLDSYRAHHTSHQTEYTDYPASLATKLTATAVRAE